VFELEDGVAAGVPSGDTENGSMVDGEPFEKGGPGSAVGGTSTSDLARIRV